MAEEVQQNDRPKIHQLELQADGLKIRWGPKKGPWGIYREDMQNKPVDVEIKEWRLYVGGLVNQQKSELESDEIFSQSVGTKTEMIIQLDNNPGFRKYKTVVAQVIGIFDSEDIAGKPFEEGIYSDVAQKEIK